MFVLEYSIFHSLKQLLELLITSFQTISGYTPFISYIEFLDVSLIVLYPLAVDITSIKMPRIINLRFIIIFYLSLFNSANKLFLEYASYCQRDIPCPLILK